MSRIVKRYCMCSLLFVGILLYIFYTQLGEDELDHFNSNKFIEIGFTSKDDEDDGVDNKLLVNLTNFEFKISPIVCKDKTSKTEGLLAIIVVTTYAGHDEVRSAHRSAISQSSLRELGFMRVFLLAEIPSQEKFITQKAIFDESQHFNDIVQGNFIEAYRNLTYKHIMGLKWASAQDCLRPKFILKMDDDIVVDFYYLSSYLKNISTAVSRKENFLAGYVLREVRPIRMLQNKWFVSYEEYPGDLYPDYLSGWMYVTIPATARELVRSSSRSPMKFFWIDDTWVTGVLRDHLNIDIDDAWNPLFSANSQFLDCCINDLKKNRYKCPFIAGPNGGDHKLILEFLRTYRNQCFRDFHGSFVYTKNNCFERPVGMASLKQTCVGADKHLLVESHGAAIISAIKL